jgi:hypothetical protein
MPHVALLASGAQAHNAFLTAPESSTSMPLRMGLPIKVIIDA